MNEDINNFKRFIREFPFYSDAALEVALPYFKLKTLKKGVHFIEQGKICKQIAFIQSGIFRTYYLKDGLEITTCFCRENALTTSYKSLITQQPSELSMQAIEETEILVIDYKDLQILYGKHLFWQQVGRLVAEKEFITVENYTRFLNDQTAKQRYLHILTYENDILQRVPLIHLASYLQIAPETLSRIRKDLATS